MIKELEDRFSVSTDKQVSIHSSIDIDQYQSIYVDSTLIKNAIANLIDNAIKYSGDPVNINIKCYTTNQQIHISIEDNGFGISDEDKDKIFGKFERGAAVGRKGAKGFGLGLNYVKQVVKAHGGIVLLFSNKGKGSIFSLVIPLNDQPDDNG
jgi:two-component system phosphate regulon sensor histidine kinase PhoR